MASTPSRSEPSFDSVATSSLVELLSRGGASLLVSTYQAGKLIIVRAEGEAINTHFRDFHVPMGLACSGGRLALGTKTEVLEFTNNPDAARFINPGGRHDACFLPQQRHCSGDIRIHELAWVNGEVWAVNTRFSCLSVFERGYSFTPRWRPPFITDFAAEDRCHLNGLAVVDGKVRYVTCLSRTNTKEGWRDHKRSGGCILDVPSGEVVTEGLCMPHSPRVYDGRLWVLESGRGALSVVDQKTGSLTDVAILPGFTRGLDFLGPYAFVGLSQIRESAVFSGVPLAEEGKERLCGVWVVDLRSGKVVAFLQFRGTVQEIFSVQVLSGIRFPDVITDDFDLIGNTFVLPDVALNGEWANPD